MASGQMEQPPASSVDTGVDAKDFPSSCNLAVMDPFGDRQKAE